jgi:hypothetical protein
VSAVSRPAAPPRVSNLLIAIVGCLAVAAWLALTHEALVHWFVLPVIVCGVLVGQDAVEYLRGRLSMFDPVGVLALFGVHFFFLAPMLHVAWDSYLESYIEQRLDWREWLGYMALLNAVSLCFYRLGCRRASAWGGDTPPRHRWQCDRRALLWACAAGLLISGSIQMAYYASQGGILGYIDTVTADVGVSEKDSAQAGMGIVFMVSESFPILAIIFYVVATERKKYLRITGVILAVFVAFFLLKMLFGGLRGSRASIVWALFWAAGIMHVWVRPLSRKFVAFGLCFLVTFMYLYGFYKGLGKNFVSAMEEGRLTEKSSRGMQSMLLGDLGRSDVQAFLLHRIMRADSDYRLAWGRTYVGTFALLIPRSVWPERPPIKTKEGTDAFYGAGTHARGQWYSSKVYGIAGETMLNFGPWVVPLAYLLFGVVVGRLQRLLRVLKPGDSRLLIFPFLVMWCFSIIQSDSDNLLFNFIKDGMMPLLVVFLGSRRISTAVAEAAARRELPTSQPVLV